ncbi:hypothetical protein [Acetobacterium sp.]|jgi:ABC-type transport system involved in cytochrome c biogenesis permease subunit|uniref:hypothetical protein n=1 Tax=Acetobacterium sp. TaxID=1872094 RepID=UPI000CB39653|nr:hypothetical protein [Acetobacterium sp.]MDO9491762.1 hypothetical protein [Acetobacterium sp.]PKM71075.1 MAG: hypothetical protein CVU92_10300 [Firmicutes bacterium HGW-Firmicutes-17]
MNIKMKYVLSTILVTVIAIVVYIILHEVGHCLVAMACGARITKFSIISASMAYEGGVFNRFQFALFNAVGALFPIIVSFFLLCFYRRNQQGMVYHQFYFMFSLISIASLFAWILVPICSFFTEVPQGDDVTKFMLETGLSPLIVIFGALMIIVPMIFLMGKKGVLGVLINIGKEVA